MTTELISSSPVSSYFEGRSIFVTGGTGFCGTVLIEKLLRACPGFKHIYVLIRTKKGKTPQDRLDNLLGAHIFKAFPSESLKKVIPIVGDVKEPELGMSLEDIETIINEVSVIFHVAATVKFDEELLESIKINVNGTISLLELARKVRNLSSIIHVSTAYSHCYMKTTIEEKFYPMPSGNFLNSVEEIVTKYKEAKAEGRDCTQEIIGVYPNTYTFTKGLAEKAVEERSHGLPIAIVRPSIVIATLSEPFPGWVDNYNGPTGLFAAAGAGVLHTVHAKRGVRPDPIPVDILINLMCVAAWKMGTKTQVQNRPRTVPIYNCTTDSTVKLPTFAKLQQLAVAAFRKNPMEQVVYYPTVICQSSKFLDRISRVLLHWIPAYCGDAYFKATGAKPVNMVLKTQRVTAALHVLEYFISREWSWSTNNNEGLYSEISKGDQKLWNFSMKGFEDWSGFFENYILGIRRFVLRNDPNTIEAQRKNMWKYHLVHNMLLLFILVLLYRGVAFMAKYVLEV